MLGHEVLSVRIGGVAGLHYLAINHFERYGWRVCRILDAFMDLRRKGVGEDEGGLTKGVSRTVGGSYDGGVDGAEAFEAFWDIQENIGTLTGAKGWKRRWRRVLNKLRPKR